MLENFGREYREMLEKMKLYLENFRKSLEILENLSNLFNDLVRFKKNLFSLMY